MTKQKLIPVLAGFLAVQILLAVGLNIGGGDDNAAPAEDKLLTADANTVSAVRIEGDEQTVGLERGDGGWIVQSMDFPADENRITELLDKLTGLKRGWPVATTEEGAERFKVLDGNYVRKVTLARGDEALAEMYTGTSAGLRKVHARAAGDDNNVYAVELGTRDLPTNPKSWIDKGILERDPQSIARVELSNGITLERRDDKVVVGGLGDNERTVTAEAGKLMDRIASINIKEVFGKGAKPEYNLEQPSHTIALTTGDGETIQYSFNDPEEVQEYVLKSSNNEHYFMVSSHTVNTIFDTARDKLVEPVDAGSEAPDPQTPDGGEQSAEPADS